MPQSAQQVRATLEPEIQYKTHFRVLDTLQKLLIQRDGEITDDKTAEHSMYCDTRNNRLFREGIECRVRKKGSGYRMDVKTPAKSNKSALFPDENGILWRYELKAPCDPFHLSLEAFEGQRALNELSRNVSDAFDKVLKPKFISVFDKLKIEREIRVGRADALIEYSLQRGYIETLDGIKTRPMGIIDLELREGPAKALLMSQAELAEIYSGPGLVLLPQRKVVMGFDHLEQQMKQSETRQKLRAALDPYRAFARRAFAVPAYAF